MSNRTATQRRVYITGAQGFLGRHAARAFSNRGWHVIGLGRQSLPSGGHTAWGMDCVFTGDIAPHLLRHAHHEIGPPDVIVHAAGTSSVSQAAQDPFGELSLTVGSTAAVIDYMREQAPQARLIFVSSAATYGNGWSRPIPVDTPIRPISIYGLHKQLCEEMVVGCRSIYGLDGCIVRYFSLYGPGLTKQLLWDVARRLVDGEAPLRLGGTGEETRDFLYVEDAAQLLVLLAERDEANVLVNGATGTATNVRQIVDLVASGLAPGIEIDFTGINNPGDPRNLVADVGCLDRLGFVPQTSLSQGVATYVRWASGELARAGETPDVA